MELVRCSRLSAGLTEDTAINGSIGNCSLDNPAGGGFEKQKVEEQGDDDSGDNPSFLANSAVGDSPSSARIDRAFVASVLIRLGLKKLELA